MIRNACMMAAFLGVVALSAQDRKVELPSSAITVTGCLQPVARPAPVGRTPLGTTPTPSGAGSAAAPAEPAPAFVLTEATPAVPSNAPTPPAPTGVGTKGTLSVSYALDGNDLELAQQSGHRVEVTGTLAAPASPATSATSATGVTTGAGNSPVMQSGVQRLHVTSIKVIAPDCMLKS